jgi:aryl-alcohol dehydrogenase-like predicted oxidoreductase
MSEKILTAYNYLGATGLKVSDICLGVSLETRSVSESRINDESRVERR